MTIGAQKTPGRPVEVVFAADTTLADDQQELLLIGRALSGTTGTDTVIELSSVSDLTAATAEAELKFGADSELSRMVIAAVAANASAGRSTFPPIKCIPLASDATTITANAQTAAKQVKAEFIVSPFDGNTDTTNRTTLKELCAEMSGAQRVENNQYGSIGVCANMAETDPANLTSPDSQFLQCVWFRNGTPGSVTTGEIAAAVAAVQAGNISPFNPVDNFWLAGVDAPALADRISVGAGLESETALEAGWTPLRTKSNDEVTIVRSTTTRITTDGTTEASSYFDVQDFQVLYYFRKAVFARLNQPDLKNVKASNDTAKIIKSEIVRLAKLFEDNDMFQAVDSLSKQITVTRSESDRHRFDIAIPVNVIPGLHVVATTIRATTEFDTLSI